MESSVQKRQKAREARTRRKMLRNGYRVLKARQRHHAPNLNNFGGYMVIDATTNHAVLGWRFDATLDDIEAFLSAHEALGGYLA